MKKVLALVFLALFLCPIQGIYAQTTEFSYQGSLKDGASAANGNYDFEFVLFDAISGGSQVGSTFAANNVAVANGIFSVKIDFGNQFPGANRFLEIRVRLTGQPGMTILGPRQLINSAPYSVKSLNATTADSAANSAQLGGVAANQYVVTTDPRMTDARPPSAGSGNYIQNQNAAPQSSSNFNISGFGTANIFNATSQFHLNGNHILSTFGTLNLLAGPFSGQALTTGVQNAFFGAQSGFNTTTGSNNSFFGTSAGVNNTTGGDNAFFGSGAGVANTTASGNAFFGTSAGQSNTTGFNNAFFGGFAGQSNTTGDDNTFFGRNAGAGNTITGDNSFFGSQAGVATITPYNSFFGSRAGVSNINGAYNDFFGFYAGASNTSGGRNAFFGYSSGVANVSGEHNTFIGNYTGTTNITGSNNTVIGSNANVGSSGLNFATAIGADSVVSNSNTVVLGRSADTVRVPGSFASTGTITTNSNFLALGNGQMFGTMTVNTLGAATATHLCINGSDVLSACSSSIRYKKNVAPFTSGIETLNRIRPVTFDWKETNEADLGLIAEEVEAIDPLLVTYNKDNQIQGVKYDRVNLLLVNAVKEQQKIIEDQQAQIDGLRKLVCLTNKDAEICK